MYEDYKALKLSRRGKILTVTMDNPPLNAASFWRKATPVFRGR
jgi:hypothetical protein